MIKASRGIVIQRFVKHASVSIHYRVWSRFHVLFETDAVRQQHGVVHDVFTVLLLNYCLVVCFHLRSNKRTIA